MLLLVLGLAACRDDSGTAPEPAVPGDTAPATQANDTAEDARETRVVTLTLTNSGWPDEIWKEMNDWQYLYNNLGIYLDFRLLNEDQFGIMLAGGDLTDIVAPRQRFIPAIMNGNMALNLDPLIDSHLYNLNTDLFRPSVELSRLFMGGPNNHLYFLAPMVGPESANIGDMPGRGYNVRWDLYEALGMPPINSEEEFIQVLQDMVALFPETPDGLPVYAFGLTNAFQDLHMRGAMVREGTTGNFWTFNGFMYYGSFENTRDLINGHTNVDSPFWVDMRFYNRLWNLGLLHPDSLVMTSGEMGEMMNAQQFVAQKSRTNALYNAMLADDPDTLVGMVMIPSTNTITSGNKLSPAGGMPTDTIFVNANSDNWEAALEVLNIYRDPEFLMMYWNGIKGDTWDRDENGIPFLTERGIQARLEAPLGSETHRRSTGIVSSIWDWTPVNQTAIHPDGHFFGIAENFEYRAMLINPLYRHIADIWGVPTTSMYYQQFVNDGHTLCWRYDYAQVVAMGIVEIPSDILRIMTTVNEITVRTAPLLIRAETMEEFYAAQAQYWAEIAAAGENTAWEWASQAYEEAWQIASPIFHNARRNADELLAIMAER